MICLKIILIFQYLVIWNNYMKQKIKRKKLVEKNKNRWSDLVKETEKMSEDEKELEQPNQILKLVEEILEFNRQQWGLPLKLLIPNQMLRRLPITLAQLKAGNNSEKLKNEIRKLLYSLYRSKNLQKIFIKVWLTFHKNGLEIVKQVNYTDLNWIWQTHLILKIKTKTWP